MLVRVRSYGDILIIIIILLFSNFLAGVYKPRVRCYETSELCMKFERCLDSESKLYKAWINMCINISCVQQIKLLLLHYFCNNNKLYIMPIINNALSCC